MARRASPKSPALMDSIKAFIAGGIICAFAEGLFQWFSIYGLDEKQSRTLAMIAVIVMVSVSNLTLV